MDHPDDAGRTVELAISDVTAGCRSGPETELRDQLPGLEPERPHRRLGALGAGRGAGRPDASTAFSTTTGSGWRSRASRTCPADGGALLVANRAGALPSDGAMIAKAVRDEHPRARLVHLATERGIRRVPGLGMLATKVGVVADHPANLHRLLFDERELVLAFPEAADGAAQAAPESLPAARVRPADWTAIAREPACRSSRSRSSAARRRHHLSRRAAAATDRR